MIDNAKEKKSYSGSDKAGEALTGISQPSELDRSSQA